MAPQSHATARRPRLADALLVGLAGAGVGGTAWWAISAFGRFDQWHLASVVVGLFVGFGVATGARRPGVGPAVLAVLLSTAAVAVAVYFIDRSLTIAALDDAGRLTDIPLWQGFDTAADVLRSWVEQERSSAAAWLLAPVVALGVVLVPRSRP